VAARRKKYGGNKKQNFTEGWVEFKDKSIAKQVAKSLNATIIGGSKKSFYHDDMWNIKYLPKFKWDHLTERIGELHLFPGIGPFFRLVVASLASN
jgi:ESF2/ABP1 family protein